MAKHLLRYSLVLVVLIGCAIYNYRCFSRHPEGIVHHDATGHLLPAFQMTLDISSFDPMGLVRHLYEQDRWPFLLPLWLIPFVLIGGYSWEAAAVGVLATWVLAGLAMFWAVRGWTCMILPDQEIFHDLAGSTALLLFISSRIVNIFSTEIMLEVPAMVLVLGATFLYARAHENKRHARLFCLSLTLLFFLKFNYGIYAVAATILLEILRDFYGRELPYLWEIAKSVGKHPLLWISIVGIIISLLILKTGGLQFSIFDKKVSVTSPGHPIYFIFWVWGIWLAPRIRWLFQRREYSDPGSFSLQFYRTFVLWTALPIVLWLINPVKVRKIVQWAVKGAGYKHDQSPDSFQFVQSVVNEYSFTPIVGWASLVLGGLLLFLVLHILVKQCCKTQDSYGLCAFLVFSLAFLGPCLLIRNSDDRMLMPGIVFLWAATGIAGAWILSYARLPGVILGWIFFGGVVAGAVPQVGSIFDQRARYASYGENSALTVSERIISLSGNGSCVFLSETLYVDHKLIEITRITRPDLRNAPVFTGYGVPKRPRRLNRWLNRNPDVRIVLLIPTSPQRNAITSRNYRKLMEQRTEYSLNRQIEFGAVHIRALVFDRR